MLSEITDSAHSVLKCSLAPYQDVYRGHSFQNDALCERGKEYVIGVRFI